jgi:hypothetical protein
MSLALQLCSAALRLAGQLAAAEGLTFALLAPGPLQLLHSMLARGLVKLGKGLAHLGLISSPLNLGEAQSCWLCPGCQPVLSVVRQVPKQFRNAEEPPAEGPLLPHCRRGTGAAAA